MLRVVGVFRRGPRDAECAAELESHVQMHVEENLRAGMSADEARRDALLKLGGIEQTKEMYRDRRSLPWLETILQDLRFGARMIGKNPGFTAIAIFTLALGIGANAAVFSIVNAVILRPLPYKDSERLVVVNSKTQMFPEMTLGLSWPAFQKIRERAPSFQESAVFLQQSQALTGRGEPQLLETAAVSADFFGQLGVRAQRGRLLGDADREEKNGKVVVLSEALWRTRFGADEHVLGQKVQLDGQPFTVVGVAAKGFAFPDDASAWTSLNVEGSTKDNPTFFALRFLGKLKPRVEMKELDRELQLVAQEMMAEFPKLKKGFELPPTRLMDWEVSDARTGFYVLLAAATLVLLIACTNLASMLLSRGWARQQEMAVRAALGASRGRIFRQMLVESCLLGVLGGAAGVGLAVLGVRIFRTVAPEDTPRLAEIHPDWTMLAFALGCALLTGILAGLSPARYAMRFAVQKMLKEGSGTRSVGVGVYQSRIGGFLMAGEIAVAFVLLIGAGLMAQTLWQLLRQDTGLRTENVLSFSLRGSESRSAEDRKRFAAVQIEKTKRLVQEIGGLPGIENVAAVNYELLDGTFGADGDFRVEGFDTATSDDGFPIKMRYVSPTYFKTLGLAIVRGREFSENDVAGTVPVAIVNEKMAQKYWGTVDVLGKRLSISKDEKGNAIWSEVVGVVANAREFLVREGPEPEYYVPLYQGTETGTSLLVRTAREPEAMIKTISNQIWSAYPDLPVAKVTTLQATIEKSVGDERLHALLLGAFAGTGLLMALAGTYGVIAYAVERRTQEISIRVALGASKKDVLFLVGRHAFLPVLAGIGIGVPVALGAQRAIASELYGVKATDPVTFVVGAVLMILVAGVACWVPGRRAMRVDPMVALRHE
jgi:predicted permease